MVHLEMVLECACKSYEGTFMDQTIFIQPYRSCYGAAERKDKGGWGRGDFFAIEIFALYKTCT